MTPLQRHVACATPSKNNGREVKAAIKLGMIEHAPMQLRPLSYAQLVARGVSPSIARFAAATTHPIEFFDIFVRPIDPYWDYFVPPDASDVIALWESNSDACTRWMRQGEPEFVRLHHDDAKHTLVAWTEQGLLADLVRRYHEILDGQDEAADRELVRRFSDYVGFEHTTMLVDYMLADDESTGDREEFRQVFGRL